MKKNEGGIQYPIIYILISLVMVGAASAGYLAQSIENNGLNRNPAPANYYNNEVRSGSQLLEVSITP